jgi:hypothetical protein
MEYFSKLRLVERAHTFLCVLRPTEGLGFVTSHLVGTVGEAPQLLPFNTYRDIPRARGASHRLGLFQ